MVLIRIAMSYLHWMEVATICSRHLTTNADGPLLLAADRVCVYQIRLF